MIYAHKSLHIKIFLYFYVPKNFTLYEKVEVVNAYNAVLQQSSETNIP